MFGMGSCPCGCVFVGSEGGSLLQTVAGETRR